MLAVVLPGVKPTTSQLSHGPRQMQCRREDIGAPANLAQSLAHPMFKLIVPGSAFLHHSKVSLLMLCRGMVFGVAQRLVN